MYYVYRLIDPRDGSTFYIGKGKGNRALQHEIQASRGDLSFKCQHIREIWQSGEPIQYQIVDCESEAHAYEFERLEIKHAKNLTNIALNPTRRLTPRVYTISELFFDGLKLTGDRRRWAWLKLTRLFPYEQCRKHRWGQVWMIAFMWLIKDALRNSQAFESTKLSRVENGAH